MADVPATLEGIISRRLALADCPFFPCYTSISELKGKTTFGTVQTDELKLESGGTRVLEGVVRKGLAKFRLTLFLVPEKSMTSALTKMDSLSKALRLKLLAMGREFQLENCSFTQVVLETSGAAEGVLKREVFLVMPVTAGPKDDQLEFLPLTPPLNVTSELWLDPLNVTIAREKERKNFVTVLGERMPIHTLANVMSVSVEGILSPAVLAKAQEILEDLVKTEKALTTWDWQGMVITKPKITAYTLAWEGLLIRCKLELVSE